MANRFKCGRLRDVTQGGEVMNKLQHEFEAFDENIRIDNEAAALRRKLDMLKKDMEESFPEECKKYNIAVNKVI